MSMALFLTSLLAPAEALAARTRLVDYRGAHVTVPASWPVFHLGPGSRICVRFNRHAVYLGVPGTRQDCPLSAVGRTEAILIEPDGRSGARAGGLASASVLGAAPAAGSMVRLHERTHRVTITATWNRDPAAIRVALDLRSLRAAMLASNGHAPRPALFSQFLPGLTRVTSSLTGPRPHALGRTVSPTNPAAAGEVYTGVGFDTCTTQSASTMSAWGSTSPYGAVGIYIGGTNAACPWGNLSAAWVQAESAAGWHLMPIYVGLQAPGNGCGCAAISSSQAAAQGAAAALDAVAQAQALGIGVGNPIYFDMENYPRTTSASSTVLAFLQAWTQELHASGYLAGVYGSGSSGITDLVAEQGTAYVEPDDIWIADWNAQQTTSDNYVPAADWVNHQRVHQYEGSHSEKYGGVSVNIDSDYLDAATAAYGTGVPVAGSAPSIKVVPQADGSVQVTPRWPGQPGITQFRIVAGDSIRALAPVASVTSTHRLPLSIRGMYAYFEVQALAAGGQVLGSSTPTQTPASVAIFGNSAFVPAHGALAVPVSCPNTVSCHVQGSIYEGKQRLTHSVAQSVSRRGTLIRFPLTKRLIRLVADAPGHRLPVSVSVTSSSGARASRTLKLIPYTSSGAPPARRILSSSTIHILSRTSFVSDGWVGGVLVVCAARTACTAGLRVTTPDGGVIATARTQTLGVGELGYLTFTMTNRGHALLQRSAGNQLAARVVVSTAASDGGGSAPSAPVGATAAALVSLVSFR